MRAPVDNSSRRAEAEQYAASTDSGRGRGGRLGTRRRSSACNGFLLLSDCNNRAAVAEEEVDTSSGDESNSSDEDDSRVRNTPMVVFVGLPFSPLHLITLTYFAE